MEHNDWRTIRTTPLFSSLSQDVTESIVSSQGVRTYEKGALLFQQDSPSDAFFVILDGWVKLFRITPNGTEAIVGVLAVAVIVDSLARRSRVSHGRA